MDSASGAVASGELSVFLLSKGWGTAPPSFSKPNVTRGRLLTHPVRFASYDVVRLRADVEVERFLRSVAPGS